MKLLTENISDITKSFSNKPNQEKPFISPKTLAKLQLRIKILLLWQIDLGT